MQEGESAVEEHALAVYFRGRLQALDALSCATVLPHRGLAGAARETLIREFLANHIPQDLSIGTGQVFGHQWLHGDETQISTQQDIVIYRRDMPVLRLADSPLFFAESVVATIEVKTRFDMSTVAELMRTAASACALQPVETFTFQMGHGGPTHRSTPRRILTGIFYFNGPTVRTPLVKELNRLLRTTGCRSKPVVAPDFVFSVNSGLIVRTPPVRYPLS
jgi:hypothetical protein